MCLVGALLVAGCASRASVRQVNTEVMTVKNQLEELRRLQEGTGRELGRTVGELRGLEQSATRIAQEAKEVGLHVARFEARLADAEGALRGVRRSVDELAQRVTILASTPPPAPPVERERREPQAGSAEQAYTSALNNYRARELGQAVLEFMDFISKFPKHQLAANAQYWIGEAYYAQRDYQQALIEFQKMIEQYAKGNKVPDALLKIGLCYRALHDPGRAQETWQQLLQDYPGSEAARKARSFMQARATPTRRMP
jgi:tol-pal system protein YbgF